MNMIRSRGTRAAGPVPMLANLRDDVFNEEHLLAREYHRRVFQIILALFRPMLVVCKCWFSELVVLTIYRGAGVAMQASSVGAPSDVECEGTHANSGRGRPGSPCC